MDQHIYPQEAAFNAHASSNARWSVPGFVEALKDKAKQQGLWNLWIPAPLAEYD